MGGSATATLAANNVPSHSHTIQPHNHPGIRCSHTQSYGITCGALCRLLLVGSWGRSCWTRRIFHGPSYHLLSSVNTGPATGVIPIVDNSAILTTDPYGGAGGGTTAPINTLPPYISRTRIIKT